MGINLFVILSDGTLRICVPNMLRSLKKKCLEVERTKLECNFTIAENARLVNRKNYS